MSERINYIKTDAIGPNPNNPRKNFDQDALEKLAQSIRDVGMLQPVLAVIAEYGEAGYRLIAGERRWRAAKLAGLEYIPVVLKKLTPEQEAEIMLIENLQRKDLDPIEEAAAYKALLDNHGYTQEALGEKLGVSQAHIANRIRLLELPDSVQQNISRGIISASHGKVMAGYKNVPAEVLEKAAETIASDNVPVTKAADVVRRLVAEQGMPLFDNYQNKPQFKAGKGSDCYECEHRAMGARWSNEKEQPYCMDRECWERKQGEGIRKNLEKAENADVVDIGKLDYSQYSYWHSGTTDYDQSECGDCTKRKLGKDRGSQYYCLDPACMKKKKTAMTKIKNKAANDAFQAEREKIAELAEGAAIACARVGIPRQVLVYLAAQVLANIKNDFDRKLTRHLYVKEKFGWQDEIFKGSPYQLLVSDWETLWDRLETVSNEQLWEIIFEWPAVAEGIKGIREWILSQVGPFEALGPEPQIEKDLDKFLADQDAAVDELEIPDYDPDPDGHGTCRVCGCTDDNACVIDGIQCGIQCAPPEPDLCSACAIYSCDRPSDNCPHCIVNGRPGKRDPHYPSCMGCEHLRWTAKAPESPPELEISAEAQADIEELLGDDSEPKRYLDDKGRELFVSHGLWGDGEEKQYGTFWQSKSGGLHRVKSPSMPMVATMEEAQANLDVYAEKKGLKLVADEVSAKVLTILEVDDALPEWRTILAQLDDIEVVQACVRETRPSARSKLRQEIRRRAKETA